MALDDKPGSTPPVRRRGRVMLRVALVVPVLLLLVVGAAWYVLTRPPAHVSVPEVINRFRTAGPSATAGSGRLPPAPPAGVYLYATTGTERISSGGVKHTYPKVTTLTVEDGGCGLHVRWDALAGRWQDWQLCPTSTGWQLQTYVDAHKFLYLQDTHNYRCTGDPWVADAAQITVVCDTGKSRLTSVIRRVGVESVRVGGTDVSTTHVHVEQAATGSSTSAGSLDLWLIRSTGLPARAEVHNTGSQQVLGQAVTYREDASYALVSVKPRR